MNRPVQPVPLRGPRVVVKRAAPAAPQGGGKTRKLALYLAGLLGVGLFGWLVVFILADVFSTPPPNPQTASAKEVAEFLISDKFEKLSDDRKDAYTESLRSLPDDRRREISRGEGMTSQQRRKLSGNIGRGFRREMMKDIRDFFKLSPEEQLAALGKRIDEEDARRQQFADRRANAGADKGASKGPPGGFRGGRPGGPGGPGSPGGRRGGGTEDQRQIRNEQRLSGSTPADRAYMNEYWRRLHERRAQRNPAPK